MLVISRKKNESIVLNGNITLTVVEIRGDKVRLGIVCPKEVPVHRQEVYDAIHGRSEPSYPSRSPAERAFVDAIAEQPDDEVTRLVFADWLEERGDPLGEYLRLRCLLAGTTPEALHGEELRIRQQALWDKHGAAWAATLPSAVWYGPTL